MIRVRDILIGPSQPLTILAGPCVIESEDHALFSAEALQKIFSSFPFQLIFKASYDKANRTSIDSFRGPGLEEGLRILAKVAKETGVRLVTDVHTPEEASAAASVCDMIQIPAFLCRQTDLLIAAGKTSAAINVKKGQFVAPWDMEHVAQKLRSFGNQNILLTERGTCFGYNNLVVDMRSFSEMGRRCGLPVCFDATHSVQLPGGQGKTSGGQREFIPALARAALATGSCQALFMETHANPSQAKSDAATVLSFGALKVLLGDLEKLYDVVACFSKDTGSPSPCSS